MTDRTPPPEPGFYEDVPFDEYSAWDAFRKSDAPSLLRSPQHWLCEQQRPKHNDGMTMGSMIDCLICEPDEFKNLFATRPATYASEVKKGRGENKVTTAIQKPWNLNSNTCKEIAAKLKASGKEVVSQYDTEIAAAAAEALTSHPLVAAALKVGTTQVSMVWVDAETGVTCKGRLDLFVPPGHDEFGITDFKQNKNAARGPFRRDMTNYGYHLQGGLYQEAVASLFGGLYPPFNLAVVEPYQPFGVAVYPLGPDSLATGLISARKAMVIWQEIKDTGRYDGYPVFQEELDVLPYAIDPDLRAVGMGG